ncbi:hypothetical protein [Actinomadura rugatobispora]|uniref:Intradiol ring-cleavage dioxygenase n=1 Tax=Actinomadura rugatobispora TaxID=1994 RepID=A0ABW0ZZX6_9ACTN|nr:twin-arginine translocation pathway signal [Actinomadura rugatobispora]
MTLDDPDRAAGTRGPSVRGRIITGLAVLLLAAGITWVLVTGESDGPGSAQLSASGPQAGGGRCAATETMPGGDNSYTAGAPVVSDLGRGFVVSGTVREAGSCAPVRNARVQIWMHTRRGHEALASNRGSVMTDAQGRYRLESLPVVPMFGQPHVHIAYDDDAYAPLFLRPVLDDEDQPSITVDFVLQRRGA